MTKAQIRINAAEVIVWDNDNAKYGDAYQYICTLKPVTLHHHLCELGGVMHAPTRAQLSAIHKVVFDAGYSGYLRTDGKDKKIVHLVNRKVHSGQKVIDLTFLDEIERLDVILAELWEHNDDTGVST